MPRSASVSKLTNLPLWAPEEAARGFRFAGEGYRRGSKQKKVDLDVAVIVNLHARRGSEAVATAFRRALPKAHVVASHSLEETADLARDLCDHPPGLVLSAGGDGTAIALINAIRSASPTRLPYERAGGPGFDVLGVLPLGTGNALARATGAPRWRAAIAALRQLGGSLLGARRLPSRRFDLVEVAGTLAHFAGTGWDAEIIDDFHAQRRGVGVLPYRYRNGLAGYLHGLFTRTIPRHLMTEPVEVELTNTGEDAMSVDDDGRPIAVRGGGHGAVLYRGPVSVCGAGTSSEWGFGFRAFPFAGLAGRRFCMRVYAGRALEATFRMASLWRGAHPLSKMHTWLLTRCRAAFSRPVPFQIGGDRLGHRSDVEYALGREQVDLLDWRALLRA
jgi:hypothetical protein